MKHLFITLFAIAFATTLFAQTTLKVGDVAPDFSAKDQDGKEVTLSKLKGKKIVLYFYPKDFTGGCTAQACNLRDNHESFSKAGYVVIGVSSDDEASHKKFKDQYSLPFTLVADKDKAINQKYGVWVEKEREGKKFWGTARTTFVIDEKGIITRIIDKVETAQHAQQILSN